ncbi:hypothetical protein F2P56_015174 [Juglans regia]|uniref:RNase H type-1 domain-containing protein n=2 Tax=Juglans regia TaxID=51240 RepID=A0A833XEN1_JUGRE|nr:uncharacterized protein LOC108982641 [Juglans regia]KAF5465143.1 hypothetical protein F2P56_015174 [Juglans regia]
MIQLFSSLTKVLNPEELQEFVVIARKIWWRRNSFIFKKEFVHPNLIVREARAVLKMLSEKNLDQCTNQVSPPTVSWQAPPMEWFKINWDGAVDKGKGLIGIGVVIRDSFGQVIATMRQRKKLYPDPLLAESYGALQAVKVAWEIGLKQIILEGDSLQVTKSLAEDREVLSSSSMFWSEARCYLNLFDKWEVSHVRRNDNHITHLLAKDALTISDFIITLEDPPTRIATFL